MTTILIVLYQSSHNGCHTSLNRCAWTISDHCYQPAVSVFGRHRQYKMSHTPRGTNASMCCLSEAVANLARLATRTEAWWGRLACTYILALHQTFHSSKELWTRTISVCTCRRCHESKTNDWWLIINPSCQAPWS